MREEPARRGLGWARLRREPLFVGPAAVIAILGVVALWPQLLAAHDPYVCDLARSVEPPSAGHWFGFDRQGCDYFARVLYGTRASLAIGVLSTAGAFVLAVVCGSLAGYRGGWVDAVLARLADILSGIPFILGAIVVLNAVRTRGVLGVSLTLMVLSWPPMMRLARSSVLEIREAEYVEAARSVGATGTRVLLRHVLPNAVAPVVSYAAVFVGVVIGAEATLSFLGVGLQLPALSWGLLLSGPPPRVLLGTPHLFLFPGAFVSVTVFAFVLLGDTLRDALDPRSW